MADLLRTVNLQLRMGFSELLQGIGLILSVPGLFIMQLGCYLSVEEESDDDGE